MLTPSVSGVAERGWGMEKPTRRFQPLWPIGNCVPHRHSCATLNAIYRQLLKMTLEELQLLEQQVVRLDTASLFPLPIRLAQ